MTCKDAINSDTNSEDKELYLLEKSRSYNKLFDENLEGTAINQVRLDLKFLFKIQHRSKN